MGKRRRPKNLGLLLDWFEEVGCPTVMHLDRPFDIAPDGGTRFDVPALAELVRTASGWLHAAGLRRGDRVRLVVAVRTGDVRVEVHDPGAGFTPRPPRPDPARTSGWGLYLVDELADRWGVDGAGRGTRVWFELDGGS
jgi:hypothetical protein